MTLACVECERLTYAGYVIFQLWELNDQGGRVRVRGQAPARIVAGRPEPEELASAKIAIGALARQHGLEVITSVWE
jgi:hypothetical protein